MRAHARVLVITKKHRAPLVDNNFDISDRLFHSLQTTWRLSSSVSITNGAVYVAHYLRCL